MTLGYGVRHSFSVFFPSLIEEFGGSRGNTAVMFSIHLFFYGIVAPLSGALGDFWKPKKTIIFGTVIIGISTASCFFAKDLWHFYMIFGVITPIGLACLGTPVVTPTIINWFIKSRGLAYGIAQMGGGLSFIIAIFADKMITLLGWRFAYLTMGLSIMIILIPVILYFFVGDPSEKNIKPYGSEKEIKPISNSVIHAEGWTLRKALRTHQFWLMAISQTLFWGPGCYMVLAHQVKFAQDVGYSSIFSASIFGLYGVTMVLGQICASVSDRIGREWVVVTGCFFCTVAIVALSQVQDTSNRWLLYVYALSFGFGSGLHAPTVLLGASDLFSGKHFGTITGMIIGCAGVAGSLGPWFGGLLHDKFGDYQFAFGIAILSFSLSAMSFVFSAPRQSIIFR